MSLLWIFLVGAVLYVGMQYLNTFKTMVDEIQSMRTQCIGRGASDAPVESPFVGSMSDLKKTLLTTLTQLKASA